MRQSEQNYEVNKIMSKDTAETDLNFFFLINFIVKCFQKLRRFCRDPEKIEEIFFCCIFSVIVPMYVLKKIHCFVTTS